MTEQPEDWDDIDFNPDEELIGKIARAFASADGLIFDEVCGFDDPNGLDECDSSTCVSALYDDHDAEWARSVYRRTALNWIYPLILSEREAAKAPLKAEIAALRARVSERADLELSYLARIAEMETALRPFAEHEDFHAPDDWCVTKYWSEDGETPGVTAGDFRRASAVFSKSGKPS